jgi:hypothetical protein
MRSRPAAAWAKGCRSVARSRRAGDYGPRQTSLRALCFARRCGSGKSFEKLEASEAWCRFQAKTLASAAIPDRPDRCPRPARSEATAIVLAAVKAGPAEIVPLAVIPQITRNRVDIPEAPLAARQAPHRIFLLEKRSAVAQRLLIARQEAVAMPARRRFLGNGIRRSDNRQQRQNGSNE